MGYSGGMGETVFEKIIRGEVEADIVLENEDVVAFREINPEAPVHVLVVPRTPMKDLSESTNHDPEVMGKLIHGIALTARKLGLEENGYRVVFNIGRDALQTVPYLHGHILAGKTLGWPPG
jgi:histidine triad (HIT) family protein